jgi:hypothetical protein
LSTDGNALVASASNVGIGSAWVYTRTNGVWTKTTTGLQPSNAEQCGNQVKISGDGTAFATTCSHVDPTTTRIFAVFRLVNGQWTEDPGDCAPLDPAGNSFYAPSIAMSADTNTVVVAVQQVMFSFVGGFWLFQRDTLTGTWAQIGQRYTNPLETSFGTSVVGNTDLSKIVVGGSLVSYYEMVNGAYVLQQNLVEPSNAGDWGYRGIAMNADATRLLLNDKTVPTDASSDTIGTVYLLERDLTTNMFVPVPGNITVTDAANFGTLGFGNSLAISDDGTRFLSSGYGDDSYTGSFLLRPS